MANGPGPTVKRRELGRELRRHREEAGVSREAAAEYIGLSVPSLTKGENGKQAMKLAAVRSLLQLYGVGSPEADYLLTLARAANQRGWWVTFGDTVPDWFKTYVGLEGDAAELWTWQSVVPGLLQTPRYIKAARLAHSPNASEADLERSVALREARQERLTAEKPLHVHAVMDESVLRRLVGGVDVMREQLQHLLTMAELDHVTVQVLPFSIGAHPATSSFSLLRFPDESMSTAYVEIDRGAVYPERPPDVEFYTDLFRRLSAEFAEDAEKSMEMIARAGDDLEKGARSR
jgi:transcriptional regulator with XRE-family HTH domain